MTPKEVGNGCCRHRRHIRCPYVQVDAHSYLGTTEVVARLRKSSRQQIPPRHALMRKTQEKTLFSSSAARS